MASNKTTVVFTLKLPNNPTSDDIAKQLRHIQEKTELAFSNKNKEIAALQSRMDELEGS